MLDETHDPSLRSWVESANDPASEFPIQNLPFGVFRRSGVAEPPRVGVAIGNEIVDVAACASEGLLDVDASIAEQCGAPNAERADVARAARGVRAATVARAISSARIRRHARARRTPASRILVPADSAEMLLPADIGDYTDFYASIEHATNVGSMFRPDNPLLPNYKWVPIGYHGRASSIVVSGTDVRRPRGQTRDGNDGSPAFGPSKRLDYELEIGAFIATGQRARLGDSAR